VQSIEGLGAGIGWAMAPDFGDKLIDLFQENNLRLGMGRNVVSLESINDAIQRAMFQWSNNHKHITFFNVTDRCHDQGKECNAAELYISAETTGGEMHGYAPVKVFQTLRPNQTRSRTTAGFDVDGAQISKIEVVFYLGKTTGAIDSARTTEAKPTHCFYLDETFCTPFHAAQRLYDFRLMVEISCFGVWAVAVLMALKRMAEWVVAYRKRGTRLISLPRPALALRLAAHARLRD
jgi:hypothetical protein